ncbi:hypothetical protein ANANG_G00283340 [Anguilla anguilla]|uniref:Helicase ATP-binding domain-containing protein n=1 Tax=Anguilla anguilla TaxID=7936 RepID=A0A9D3LK26_ANGAN|nr:hypothetical protein ANANG_G00283340 [Anguilla anguilla]
MYSTKGLFQADQQNLIFVFSFKASKWGMEEISLYGYQEEVIQPALEGRNIIIWLPTGGGKTRAAVYVAKRHLESRPGAKVAVLVNKVHLVDQHFNKEFQPFLGGRYRVAPISGDCDQKDFFGRVVQDSDVIICTAQILENSLRSTEEDKHMELWPPPSAGNLGPKPSRAKEHVLQICANLDASAIVSPQENSEELQRKVPKPVKKYDIVNQRPKDPFGDHLKSMMSKIHELCQWKISE